MLSAATVAWIERAVGPRARAFRVEALPASSTSKHLVTLELADGTRRRVVLRRYPDADRPGRDLESVPAHEAVALRLMEGTDVPAPRLIAVDPDAAFCDVPALLESWLPGHPGWEVADAAGYLDQAAAAVAAIHAVAVPSDAGLRRYAPYRTDEPIVSPGFSTRRGLWERVAAALSGRQPRSRETFIHRDYHPGNVLWDGMRVSGVVDWAEAAVGPPGIDLARMRLNLACRFDEDIAHRFVDAYVSAGGETSARDPYWDLLDASDLLLDVTPGDEFTRLESFVERVLAELR